jgi:hypothetical protein
MSPTIGWRGAAAVAVLLLLMLVLY